MSYLNWLKMLPKGSSALAYLKVLARLLIIDLVKTVDRVWAAMGWGFGLAFGATLFWSLLNHLSPT